ncbi:MAG: DMT family transporter [Bacteroidia bacterium]|nr:DMT family transporter [Bacteroidia bacterium]
MNTNSKAHLSIFLANLLYGANFSIAKISLPAYIQPSGFILLRVVFACILFYILMKVLKAGMKIEKKDYLKFFLLGLFGVAVNQLLFFEGLSRTSNINAALIMTANPVMVLIVAAFLVHERISSRRVLGILSGLAGAGTLILMSGSGNHGKADWHGDLMVLTNALSYSVYLVMVKPVMQKYNPWVVIYWTFFFGTLLVIPFGWHELSVVNWNSFTAVVWGSVFYVLFATTFLAYFFNTYGLQHLSPSVVSFYIYLQPVIATIISLLIAQEKPNLLQFVACICIFTGVYLVSTPGFAKAKS